MDTDLTELIEIDPTRLDGVRSPANGMPFLIMKSVASPGDPAPMPDESAVKDTPIPATDPVTDPAPVEKSTEEQISEAVAKATADAVAKAMQERDETIQGLRDEMAALKAQPIPGGPAITNAAAVKATAVPHAEIQRFERLAKSTQDRELARYYADRVAELKSRS